MFRIQFRNFYSGAGKQAERKSGSNAETNADRQADDYADAAGSAVSNDFNRLSAIRRRAENFDHADSRADSAAV